jgi:hypothetical protein
MKLTPLVFHYSDFWRRRCSVYFHVYDDNFVNEKLASQLSWEILTAPNSTVTNFKLTRLSPNCIRVNSYVTRRKTSLFRATLLSIDVVCIPVPSTYQVSDSAIETIDLEMEGDPTLGRVQEPALARRLAYWILPRRHRKAFLGDMLEDFQPAADQLGPREARCWYWKELLFEIVPILGLRVRSAMKWLAAVLGLGVAADVIRRLFP